MNKTVLFSVVLMFVAIASFAQSKFSPEKESLKLFNAYKPTIEKKNGGLVDEPVVITGDINGDGLPDCVVSFVITPKDGGNAIIGHESVIYLNTGTGMKVAGKFPEFKFCYGIDSIKNQTIWVDEYECAPPYNTFVKKRKLVYRNRTIAEVK